MDTEQFERISDYAEFRLLSNHCQTISKNCKNFAMRTKFTSLLLVLGSFPVLVGLAPNQLKCEYLDNLMGIDSPQPRLSWILESKQRGEKQTASQILTASSDTLLNLDTGDSLDTAKWRIAGLRAAGTLVYL